MTANADRRTQIACLPRCWRPLRRCTCGTCRRRATATLFYAAAAQAGSHSWSAWFFGSLDAKNFITVDKPPASLWVTGLSVRLFGMNSWSVLAPQALMGVASVAMLYAAVRARSPTPDGAAAGLLAGAVAGVHARGGVDVPLQQSRRAAGAAADAWPPTA